MSVFSSTLTKISYRGGGPQRVIYRCYRWTRPKFARRRRCEGHLGLSGCAFGKWGKIGMNATIGEMSPGGRFVKRIWSLCHILRGDGVSYHEYISELTYLLFLK